MVFGGDEVSAVLSSFAIFAVGFVLRPLGGLLIGSLADRWGRRAGLSLALVAFGVFSIGTAWAGTFEHLVLMRFLTGIGLGGALPNLISIAAESVTPERRGAKRRRRWRRLRRRSLAERAGRKLGVFLVQDHDPIAPALLGRIECLISQLNEAEAAPARHGLYTGDADAHGKPLHGPWTS